MKRKWNIQIQFMLTYIFISLICVAIFSFFIYEYLSNILIQSSTNFLSSTCNSFLYQTDNVVDDMDDIAYNIAYGHIVNPALNEFFTQFDGNADSITELTQLMTDFYDTNHEIPQINIYSTTGQKLTIGTYTDYTTVNISELEWVDGVSKSSNRMLLSFPYENESLNEIKATATSHISLYRSVYDDLSRFSGYIEVVQDVSLIFDYIDAFKKTEDNIIVYVFNEAGQLIYPINTHEDLTTKVEEYYFTQASSLSGSIPTVNPVTKEEEIMAYQISNYTNWTYVCIQEKSSMLSLTDGFYRILALVISGCMILILLLSYKMAKRFTTPIYKLLAAFQDTKADTLGEIEHVNFQTSINELDKLNNAFLSMKHELKVSMDTIIETREHEMEARNLALQAQLNPHFYYNSLSSITILAEDGKMDEIQQFSKSLSSIMRYITNGTMYTVTLGAEISYVEKYLYCMKVRYQDCLTCSINIDPSLMDISIPKLLIQPLVENAIKYGTNCDPPWNIDIYSMIDETGYKICVADSGPGFTDEVLAKLHQQFETVDTTQGMVQTEIGGLGLVNVYTRWKLFCDENTFFTCTNKEGGGGLIMIGGISDDNKHL